MYVGEPLLLGTMYVALAIIGTPGPGGRLSTGFIAMVL